MRLSSIATRPSRPREATCDVQGPICNNHMGFQPNQTLRLTFQPCLPPPPQAASTERPAGSAGRMLRSNRPKKVAVRWDSLADENQRERERERERTELATFTHTHKTPGRHLQLVVVGQTTKQHCKTSHTNPVDQLMQACVVSAAHAQALAHLVWPPSTTCRRASGQVARLSATCTMVRQQNGQQECKCFQQRSS